MGWRLSIWAATTPRLLACGALLHCIPKAVRRICGSPHSTRCRAVKMRLLIIFRNSNGTHPGTRSNHSWRPSVPGTLNSALNENACTKDYAEPACLAEISSARRACVCPAGKCRQHRVGISVSPQTPRIPQQVYARITSTQACFFDPSAASLAASLATLIFSIAPERISSRRSSSPRCSSTRMRAAYSSLWIAAR